MNKQQARIRSLNACWGLPHTPQIVHDVGPLSELSTVGRIFKNEYVLYSTQNMFPTRLSVYVCSLQKEFGIRGCDVFPPNSRGAKVVFQLSRGLQHETKLAYGVVRVKLVLSPESQSSARDICTSCSTMVWCRYTVIHLYSPRQAIDVEHTPLTLDSGLLGVHLPCWSRSPVSYRFGYL